MQDIVINSIYIRDNKIEKAKIMNELLRMIGRSALAMVALLVSTKVMGRRELAEMSMFDYIVGITIGAIGAELAINLEEPWFDYIFVLSVFIVIHKIITVLTMKSMIAKKFFQGAPIVVMEDGKLIYKNLQRVHYDINTLLEECRLAGYFDLGDLNTIIMESTGTLSFIKKMKDKEQQKYIVANIIVDGKILYRNIEEVGFDKHWIQEALKSRKIEEKDVLLAIYSEKKGLMFHLKEEKVKVKHTIE